MKLHELLEQYLTAIESTVEGMAVYVEQYQEEILTESRVNLRLRLRFENEHLLAINEAVVVEGNKLKCLGYRYHLQDGGNKMMFRYDDTPHFPDLATFPHHKHWLDDVLPSSKPAVIDVLEEAQTLSTENN